MIYENEMVVWIALYSALLCKQLFKKCTVGILSMGLDACSFKVLFVLGAASATAYI